MQVLEIPKRETASIHGAGLNQEARSENDHVVASANGWGCVGAKHANMQVVSQRGGHGSPIVPKAPKNTQAREGQGTAPGQACNKSKRSLRHGSTATEGTCRRRECAFSSTATVKDEAGRCSTSFGLMIRCTHQAKDRIRSTARPTCHSGLTLSVSSRVLTFEVPSLFLDRFLGALVSLHCQVWLAAGSRRCYPTNST